MSSANPAHVAATTETDFQSFSAVVLKPLLQFISTECLASLPASSLEIADFVIQLLTANKELVNQLCRGGKTSMRLEKPNPPSVSYSESLLKCNDRRFQRLEAPRRQFFAARCSTSTAARQTQKVVYRSQLWRKR